MMPVMSETSAPIAPIVSVATLAGWQNDPASIAPFRTLAVVDCRFDLGDPTAGEVAYLADHIPGAVYAHLDRDLSGPKNPAGQGGRHPLPSLAAMTNMFGRLGIDSDTLVVAYDNTSGHYAARLWWMLDYLGHKATAVLDGGWPAWLAAGLPVESGPEPVQKTPRRLFIGVPQSDRLVQIDDVQFGPLLVDSRAPERYRGEIEPLDPVAGHIPGAVNRPYQANWTVGGNWREPQELRGDLLALLGEIAPEDVTFYCGSGVSACVNLLALAHAGLPAGRLYVGSWSEWSRLGQPVARET
jgi:thiosulfate/3-mercaptopyruvate sulfurtransferase